MLEDLVELVARLYVWSGSGVRAQSEMGVENNLMAANGSLGKIGSAAGTAGTDDDGETNTMPRNIGNRFGPIWSLNVP